MRLGLFSAYFTTGSSKCMSEVSMQKFASYHTNRTLDAQDFFRVNGSEQFDLTELNTLRDELNRAIQYWIIYMLEKTSKTALSNKKTFIKHLQIVVNLNKFELNEENIKLSGIYFVVSMPFLFLFSFEIFFLVCRGFYLNLFYLKAVSM